jgi:carboxyl-terminal processing protease
MKFCRNRLSLAAVGILAWGMVQASAEPSAAAQEAGNEAATHLWQSFLKNYRQFSLEPLDAEALDAKAREVLIETAGPKFRTWKPDAEPSLLALVTAMNAQSQTISKFSRIEQTLEALLPKIDIYGHYKPAADVSQLREALRQNPGSIHLTLDQAADGRVLCYPLEKGPAELAGIKAGAVLLSADGRAVEGKSISALRLAFVGPPNTPIRLKVRQPQGKIEEFAVLRNDQRPPKIVLTKTPLGLTLKIRSFEEDSAKLVKHELEPYPKPARLTIDLRGNPGGLRDEALKVASLFFPQNTALGQFTTHNGIQTANDGNGVSIEPTSIQILQDGRTASAAEFLIATLKEGLPEKVTLFGAKTYGKSHSTYHVTLDGGGELAVTETLLATASGKSWDKTGIAPDQAIKRSEP